MSFFKKYKQPIDILFWIVLVAIIAYKFGYQQMAPSITFSKLLLVNEAGQNFRIEDYSDKNLLINFYQSWCGPCIQEMPSLSNAYLKLKKDDFVFIAVSDEPFSLINKVKSRTDNQMIFLQSKQNFDQIGVRAYPTSYLINKKGEIVFEKVGPEQWDSPEMEAHFRELVQ